MSGDAFGAYDTASGKAEVPDGTYEVAVKSVQVVKRNGEPVRDQRSNKIKIAIVVTVEAGEHKGVDLKRTTTIAYGANSENGAYAVFAQFLEAATGVKCGDPEQKKLGEPVLKGKRLLVTVLENSKGYADIVRFKSVPTRPATANPPGDPTDQDLGHHRRQPQPRAGAQAIDPFVLLSEGQRRVILERAAQHGIDHTTEEGMTLLRGMTRSIMNGGHELDVAHIPQLMAKIAERKPVPA